MRQIACLFISLLLAGCHQSAGWYALNAQLAGPAACGDAARAWKAPDPSVQNEWNRSRSLLLGGHCIASGDGAVLRYIESTHELPFISDTEDFIQITMAVPSLPQNVGEVKNYSLDRTRFYFSDTGPFYNKGYGWFGTMGTGSLTVTRISEDSVRVTGSVMLDAQHARSGTRKQQSIKIYETFKNLHPGQLESCLGATPLCPSGR